jgi:hypothetical protein
VLFFGYLHYTPKRPFCQKGTWLYSLSLWERVGVRVLGCTVRAGVSLILAFSQREKGQSRR